MDSKLSEKAISALQKSSAKQLIPYLTTNRMNKSQESFRKSSNNVFTRRKSDQLHDSVHYWPGKHSGAKSIASLTAVDMQ
jgi:hypothetical protein